MCPRCFGDGQSRTDNPSPSRDLKDKVVVIIVVFIFGVAELIAQRLATPFLFRYKVIESGVVVIRIEGQLAMTSSLPF